MSARIRAKTAPKTAAPARAVRRTAASPAPVKTAVRKSPVETAPPAPPVAPVRVSHQVKADGKRAELLAAAARFDDPVVALAALREAALLRKSNVEPSMKAPTNRPQSPTAHPAAQDGTLACYGACGLSWPVSRFVYIGPKATAKGRRIECQQCSWDRAETNKARRAAGLAELGAPRVPDADLG